MSAKRQRRAVVYVRISSDETGERAGVERQRADCVAQVEREGWHLVAVVEDNDISASRYARRKRPGYTEVLRLIDEGSADTIVAWHVDRLYRQPKELEALIDRVEQSRRRLRIVTLFGELDLTTPDGLAFARVLVAMSAKESDDKSRRLKRAFDSKAERGLPHGARAFGYEPNGMAIIEKEADAIRAAAKDVLLGATLESIARQWNAAGFRSPQHRRDFSGPAVKVILKSPRNAGYRVHRGEVIGRAAWPAILDETTHRRLLALFNDPARRAQNPPRRMAWTRFVYCDCGAAMTRDKVGERRVYRCHKRPGRPGCGSRTIPADKLENLLFEAVMMVMDNTKLAQMVVVGNVDTDGVEDELREVERRMDDLADAFAAGEIDRPRWSRAHRKLEATRDDLRGRLARHTTVAAVEPYAGRPGALRAAWPSLTVDQQRAVIGAVIDRVTINPATKRGPKFEPDRVDIIWKV